MGVVYVAERADGEFEQTVALKLVRPDSDSPLAQDLLRRERQTSREARTSRHRAFDRRRTQPPTVRILVRARIRSTACGSMRILRIACAMSPTGGTFTSCSRTCARIVQFAHGRLLVHRDIKPANILDHERTERD